MRLIETRVSEIKPGDLWLYDGAWVAVHDVVVGYPDDRVEIDYTQDDEASFANPWGFERAAVKRPDIVHSPHDIDAEQAHFCTVCHRDVQWDDDADKWEHV